ncbi:hypothetical protein C8261_09040 [Pseudothauera lacus]|uniref:Secreted protein n=2 Tax=Pseudothauera lacus TaxID=2136175 RepID=A0A2T4IFN2_9RHOO|nr:hypothetical protein C8261_09040 [Pseudothauera lacus]
MPARLVRFLLLAALFATSAAVAAPAPWYQWRSKLNGALHCAQTSPGEGWERVRGPFRDVRCERPVRVPNSLNGV